MQFTSLIGHSAQLYHILRKSHRTGEDIASDYFRSRKYIGSKDRKFISELLFSSLRVANLIEYCAKHANTIVPIELEQGYPYDVMIAHCMIGTTLKSFPINNYLHPFFGVKDADEGIMFALEEKLGLQEESAQTWKNEIWSMYEQICNHTHRIIEQNDIQDEQDALMFSLYCAMPLWIVQHWHEQGTSCSAIAELCKSLHAVAPVGLRINAEMIERSVAIEILHEEHIPCKAGAYSPYAIIMPERIPLTHLDLFLSGAIEVQDEGSQLISLAVSPKEHWRILDYCAGAGGKSLHMAMLQHDQGEILSTDIDYSRMREIRNRAERAGYFSIRIIPMHLKNHAKSALMQYAQTCDGVLVDAPCTGMGTVRRSPNIKWNLKKKHVESIQRTQLEILTKASAYVKPGGVLVYATCSLMQEENEEIVKRFLMDNDAFALDPLMHAFPKEVSDALLSDDPNAAMLSMNPAKHGSDGFYMCRMIRKPIE
ncbi:MAG: RsmB/NOP family class I SAM-dependent RNA methyltransferase [Bacteroidota bacterium]